MAGTLWERARRFEQQWRSAQQRETAGKQLGPISTVAGFLLPGLGTASGLWKDMEWEKGRQQKRILAHQLVNDPALRQAVGRTTQNKEIQFVINRIRKRRAMQLNMQQHMARMRRFQPRVTPLHGTEQKRRAA